MLFLRLNKYLFVNLEKARNHKYIDKKPDGKGGWIYIYKEFDYRNSSFNEKNLKIINNFIFNIKEKEIEHAGFFDETGKLFFYKKGEGKHIRLSDHDYGNLKDRKISLFIHNHTSENSFSPDDVFLFLKYNIKEMLACHGKTRFRLKRKQPIPIPIQAEINFAYRQSFIEKNRDMIEKVRSRERTKEQADDNFSHPLVEDIVKKYGEYIEYEKRRF